MRTNSIVVAGSNLLYVQQVKKVLRHSGFQIIKSPSIDGLTHKIQRVQPALVILGMDHNRTKLDLTAVEIVRKHDKQLPILAILKQISTSHILQAMRAGVNDCLLYPFGSDELKASLTRCLNPPISKSGNHQKEYPRQSMIGNSRCTIKLKTYLKKIADTDSTLLITGETGTGKEVAASIVHHHSRRSSMAFVCVNSAALPDNLTESELFGFEKGAFTGAVAAKKGKFDLANGGTLFLDEIGDMSLLAQAKILRTIENKEAYRLGGLRRIPIDVRIIAATNRNIDKLIEKRQFREDLFYRLNVAHVFIPPLRERKEDLEQLIDYYISLYNSRFSRDIQGFTAHAREALFAYHWPGNVRELKNLIEAAFINLPDHTVKYMDLPAQFKTRLNTARNRKLNERDRLLEALYATGWNKSKAARKLKWSRMTLYRKMAKYAIAV
jgi:DNA-binding NtrC family response regulator